MADLQLKGEDDEVFSQRSRTHTAVAGHNLCTLVWSQALAKLLAESDNEEEAEAKEKAESSKRKKKEITYYVPDTSAALTVARKAIAAYSFPRYATSHRALV